MSKQKFPSGTYVFINRITDVTMYYFECMLPARVEYTYKQIYSGDDTRSYSLLVRFPNGKWSSVAWYCEHQLTEILNPDAIKQYDKELESYDS